VTSFVDINDARAARAVIAAARHKERLVTQHVSEGWAILDRSGVVTEVSEYSAIAKWGPHLVGSTLIDLVDEGQRAETAALLDQLLGLPGRPLVTELYFEQPEGDLQWYEVVFVNLFDDPVVEGIVANVRDITDRRRSEDATRFQATLLDAVGQAVIATDENDRIMYWNRAAELTYGWSAAEAFGQDISTVAVSDHSAEQTAEIRASLAADRSWTGEQRVRRKDGSVFPVLLTLTPLLDGGGALSGIIGVSTDITERKRFEHELERLALRDALTGLPNRALLADRLEQALRKSPSSRRHVAVVFADVDRFKLVNDSMGHSSGDDLLVFIARRISAVLPDATVARFGGDEFVVVLDDVADRDEAMELAHKLVDVTERPFNIAGTDIYATISAGVVVADFDATVESMIRDADVAMYQAKKAGGGQVRAFDERDLFAVRERMEVERELREALCDDQLEVFYQPILELETECVVGAEALVRWRHPRRGLLEPSAFLSVAEATGIIGGLTRFVLRTACTQAASWACKGNVREDFRMSVNLSASDIADPELSTFIQSVLVESGCAANRLIVEVTETALVEDTDTALSCLRDLRRLGVRVALDDFGTGYSSLSYLRRFPVDVVKIDRSFVAGVGRDPEDTALIDGIVSLGRALGLATVAEGIEDQLQADELHRLGCELGQGYLWSPPVPAEEFIVAGRLAGVGGAAIRVAARSPRRAASL
jgi:diguanylate cyclase (GGDEF)-like protein/PAS domain S-box-containing protein